MSQIDECPTSLFPTTKKPFWDCSDVSSIPSDTCLSRCNSFPETPVLDDCGYLGTPETQFPQVQDCDTDFAEEDLVFSSPKTPAKSPFDEIYQRIEEFFDQEELFLETPKPCLEIRTSICVLNSFSLHKSEVDIKVDADGDSSFSDSQGPSFLMRRAVSGVKSGFSGLLLRPRRSDADADGDSSFLDCQTPGLMMKRVVSGVKSGFSVLRKSSMAAPWECDVPDQINFEDEQEEQGVKGFPELRSLRKLTAPL